MGNMGGSREDDIASRGCCTLASLLGWRLAETSKRGILRRARVVHRCIWRHVLVDRDRAARIEQVGVALDRAEHRGTDGERVMRVRAHVETRSEGEMWQQGVWVDMGMCGGGKAPHGEGVLRVIS